MPNIKAVGHVENDFDEKGDMKDFRQQPNTVIIDPKYEEGLFRIEEQRYLKIIFYFHKSEGYNLKGSRRHGDVRGVFASRSPHRPGQIGVTTVKLLERQGRKLTVKGLDALNGTPVLDIKPYVDFLDRGEVLERSEDDYNPRHSLEDLIENKNEEELLWRAGKLHGHYCPNLALGVKASVYALNHLNLKSEGMEEVLAIVETNSCFSDGVQYITGCTFGNNALIYKDFGKTAVTITSRDGKALRLYLKEVDLIADRFPEAEELFEKVIVERNGSFEDSEALQQKWKEVGQNIIEMEAEDLFKIEEVNPEIPDYAPIYEDEFCSSCGEKIMSSRAVEKDGDIFCIPCSNSEYQLLDGRGISLKKQE